MDKKSGKSLMRAMKELGRGIQNMLAPWIENRRIEQLKKRMAEKPKGVVYNEDGTVADLNDPNLWKME